MPNDYTGRQWKITGADTTPFGAANIRVKGGIWTGGAAGETFIITDIAGRVYQWTFPANGEWVPFQELGWLSGPVAFSGTFSGEVILYIAK
jgi:hypothetical protein